MKMNYALLALVSFAFLGCKSEVTPINSEYELVWSDEFDSNTLDETKWGYQTGNGCDINLCNWGNNEAQNYRKENVVIENGTLSLVAKKENFQTENYTSGRIRTLGKFDQKYGKFEAKIRFDGGQGLWGAFWLLPSENKYGGWPRSGEIDIVEFVGHQKNSVIGTVHYGNNFSDKGHTGNNSIYPDFTKDFHIFSIEWEEDKIKWFVDNVKYHEYTLDEHQTANDYIWPFNEKFHIILNLAIGGTLANNEIDDTIFPAKMEIDYVRVYNKK